MASSNPRRSVISAAGSGVLLTISLAAGIAVLEGAARLLRIAPEVLSLNTEAPFSSFRLAKNPVLGYEMKPGYRDDFPDYHQSFPYVNQAGFRDIERSVTKAQGVERVILLGDSVVAGVGIREMADLMSAQLEAQLEARTKRPYEVLNMGVPGYCTYGEIELLATVGLEYDPDAVVVVFVENDYNDGNFLFGDFSIERPRYAEWLFLNSALFRWAGLRWDWFSFAALDGREQSRSDRSMELVRYSSKRFLGAIGSAEESHVVRALRRLSELSAARGFPVVVAVWPRFYPIGITEGDHDLIDGEMAITRIARELGFQVVMLSEAFRADYAQARAVSGGQPNALDLYTLSRGDPMHPNPKGATVAAAELATVLAPGSSPVPSQTRQGSN